ncbi:MAG: acyl-CoA dehydrogenase family protein [Deltaproteobacteria bacterium]|nr:acyl-CoA dehydrogenase family protein [Deltaproteobacteria bacterium]MBW2363172.1 acyl-CoA dehydrogenase family protein [Deltaproteobacteria bacterium]
MPWDFETEPEFQQKLDWMRSFIDEQLIPLEPMLGRAPAEEWALVKRHLQQQVKAQGLWACHLDPALGGPGFGQMKLALMHELIGRCPYSMEIFGNQAPDSGNSELLATGANEAQKERWLWPNIAGTLRSAFALTEPFEAGADPTRLRTTARRDGDDWVIDGHKWFCTNGSFADFIIVMAETNPEGRPYQHASMFVVEKGTPGLNIVRDIPTMREPDPVFGELGNHAEILFESCRVPAENLIGNPGDGFILAQKRLGGGRIHHAMRWIGLAKRALEITCERAVSRESHGRRLADHQMVQGFIFDSRSEIEAARLITFQAAWKMDRVGARAARADISMAKATASRMLLAVLDRGIQVCGALGYSGDLPLEEWYRTNRFGPIGDGPDEVHKVVVVKDTLKGIEPVEGWPTAHIPSRREASQRDFAQLLQEARRSTS